MPRFNRTLQLRTFAGLQIPKESTKAVPGREFGVYFHWQGKWRFTVIRGFTSPATALTLTTTAAGTRFTTSNST
ncbi:DUF7274 domain-containing protein, partial [Enterobacter hormaechei]